MKMCDISSDHYRFHVWAPFAEKMELEIIHPHAGRRTMERQDGGVWTSRLDPGPEPYRYRYLINGHLSRPDPASHFQPEGVHGPSQVIDHRTFAWQCHTWPQPILAQMILYELHVGTFTEAGTFSAIIDCLDDLKETGVNALELMPVAQFPGQRNWGYDGVYPYAVQNSYGGPDELKQLVDACHQRDMWILLDVVYNHLGPEGNYLRDFGPYFTGKYHTPWGEAVNFDDAYSDRVRDYFCENALHWLREYRMDGLRLDAVHAIYDQSAMPFLRELAQRVHAFNRDTGRRCLLIAESDLNDSRLIRPAQQWGDELDAQWSDDFHHSVHALLTGEDNGYYQDFGRMSHLQTALSDGYVYSGQYSAFRKRRHGNASRDVPLDRFVICTQNHDQVGNRMQGERLVCLAGFEAAKLAAGVLLLSPSVPLLFMGQEYAEEAPFQYFVSHNDPGLVEAVRQGRQREFEAFRWQGRVPDPQSPETFNRSRLQWDRRNTGQHAAMRALVTTLIDLRRTRPALHHGARDSQQVRIEEARGLLILQRRHEQDTCLAIFNFSRSEQTWIAELDNGSWSCLVSSSDSRWQGPGPATPERIHRGQRLEMSAQSFLVFSQET